MNLAYRDIKHNLLRFVLTNFGLSLLLGIVIMITGVYGGLIDDALRQARAANADLWVVEAGTNGPFAESSRIPATRANWSAGSTAWNTPARSLINRCRPSSTTSAAPVSYRLRAGRPAAPPALGGARSCAVITK